MIRLSLAALALALSAFSVAACNTVHGLGRDIEAAGRGIARSSDEVRSDHRRKSPPAQSQRAPAPTTTTTSPPSR
ncbi:MAG: entericidin A/B family lipoprotein [Hyphomonadaceae bacterium]|nr:entericidin A/B family lipoprotein [Hyphomonadaceae bacterium]